MDNRKRSNILIETLDTVANTFHIRKSLLIAL